MKISHWGSGPQWLILLFLPFVLGVLLAGIFPAFAIGLYDVVAWLVEAYRFLAPTVIYFVLAVSLGKFVEAGASHARRFIFGSVLVLLVARGAALIFAWIFAGLVFRLPWGVAAHVSCGTASGNVSPAFLAIALALATIVLARRWPAVRRCLDACAQGVDAFGEILNALLPLFLFALGGYVAGIAHVLPGAMGGRGVGMYLWGSALTGICCLLWHAGLLLCCRAMVKDFSIVGYVRDYWMRLYPMLWVTASESLSTPLNLHLVKERYPALPAEARRFIIGVGSYLNINGTMMCTVLLTCLAAQTLGIAMTWERLSMLLPLIFLIGFAVPGIPGELLLFAAPLAAALNLPPDQSQAFIALLMMLQFGLPDSFRTGCNSTDSLPLALMLGEGR